MKLRFCLILSLYLAFSASTVWAGGLSNLCNAIVSKEYGFLYGENQQSKEHRRIRNLLIKKRYLQAAWELQDLGEMHKAQEIIDELENVVRNSKIKKLRKVRGDSGPILVELDDGQMGIFKSNEDAPSRSYKHELAAYQIAKALGLRRVPITVEREFNGKKGSLQLFVKGRHPTKNSKFNWGNDGLFFEYLIGNYDFYPQNIIVLDTGKPVFIDHDAGFPNGYYVTTEAFTKIFIEGIDWMDLNPSKEITEKFKSLSELNFKALIEDYLSSTQIDEFMKRRAILIKKLKL